MKIADLKPNKRNPRKISDEKKAMLAKAIEEFGDLGGIVFNRKTKQLVGGHQRVSVIPADSKIEIENKYKKPTRTGTVAEGHIILKGEKFKYREVSWDIAKEESANIAANQHGGEFDSGKLVEIVNELMLTEMDMDLLGFSPEELAAMLPQPEDTRDADAVPELPKEPKSKLGDLYELGDHRLLCADSTSIDAVEKLLKGMKADCLITDPPYGINYQSGYRKNKFDVLKNDDSVLTEWTGCVDPYVKGWAIFFIGWQRMSEWLDVGKTMGNLTNILIWKKSAAMGDLTGSFSPTYELALAYNRGAKLVGNKRPSAILECNIDAAEGFVHPTQKPVKIFEMILDAIPSTSVLDLFGGSGSTLIACEKTNRKCFMMELDPHYVDVIVSRYCKFSGISKIIRNGKVMNWTINE